MQWKLISCSAETPVWVFPPERLFPRGDLSTQAPFILLLCCLQQVTFMCAWGVICVPGGCKGKKTCRTVSGRFLRGSLSNDIYHFAHIPLARIQAMSSCQGGWGVLCGCVPQTEQIGGAGWFMMPLARMAGMSAETENLYVTPHPLAGSLGLLTW